MRRDIARAAESFIGTPFRHQGRRPGAGLDCVGVWVCALGECGIEVKDVTTYRRLPDSKELLQNLRLRFDEVQTPEPGDALVLLEERSRQPRHMGVYVGAGKVVDTYRGKAVRRRTVLASEIHAVFRVREGEG